MKRGGETKRCSTCQEYQPLKNFNKDDGVCKECRKYKPKKVVKK